MTALKIIALNSNTLVSIGIPNKRQNTSMEFDGDSIWKWKITNERHDSLFVDLEHSDQAIK